MGLTEQERQKIYEEEKVRLEAQEKLKGPKTGTGCFVAVLIVVGVFVLLSVISLIGKRHEPKQSSFAPQVRILDDFETKGIWRVDRTNHRCLIDGGVWVRLPFEQKEQCLKAIYLETNTWWEIYDSMSGKLLGEVSSWGCKVHP